MVILFVLSLSGCKWDSSLYEHYVQADGSVSLCPGACDTSHITRDACLRTAGSWVDGKCRLNTDENGRCRSSETLEAARCVTFDGKVLYDENNMLLDQVACEAHEDAHYEAAWCRPATEARCTAIEGAQWVGYNILDLGQGRYIRKINGQFICGHYNAIVSYNAADIDTYGDDIFKCEDEERSRAQNSMDEGICPTGSRCMDAYRLSESSLEEGREELVVENALCNTCADGMAECSDDPSDPSSEYKCVDLMSRIDHCGKCNHVCEAGTYCQNGICINGDMDCDVEHGELACYCVRLPNHALSCTSERGGNAEFKCVRPQSAEDCGITACEYYSGETICKNGRECLMTQVGDNISYSCACTNDQFDTGERCVSRFEPDYCGSNHLSKGTACDAGTQLCNGTSCVCTNGMLECDSDAENNQKCKNIVDDVTNCGACGNDCNAKYDGISTDIVETCEKAVCQCPENTARCGSDRCINTQFDNDHCGAQNNCNHFSPYHPDYWGEECGEGKYCSNGQCVCNTDEGYVVCGEECIDPMTDLKHCGADSACSGGTDCSTLPGTACVQGQCKCTDTDKELITTNAAPGCYNTQWDPKCCGTQCKECGENNICKQGTCVTEGCPVGLLNCQGYCLDEKKEHVAAVDAANQICGCDQNDEGETWCDGDGDPNNGCHASNGEDYTTGTLDHCGTCDNKCADGYTVCKNKACACRDEEVLCHYGEEVLCLNFEEKHLRACQADETVTDYCAENWADSDDDPKNEPVVRWRAHSSLLFTNWLNYYVFQHVHLKP